MFKKCFEIYFKSEKSFNILNYKCDKDRNIYINIFNK
jgi:hypothetical protein